MDEIEVVDNATAKSTATSTAEPTACKAVVARTSDNIVSPVKILSKQKVYGMEMNMDWR